MYIYIIACDQWSLISFTIKYPFYRVETEIIYIKIMWKLFFVLKMVYVSFHRADTSFKNNNFVYSKNWVLRIDECIIHYSYLYILYCGMKFCGQRNASYVKCIMNNFIPFKWSYCQISIVL